MTNDIKFTKGYPNSKNKKQILDQELDKWKKQHGHTMPSDLFIMHIHENPAYRSAKHPLNLHPLDIKNYYAEIFRSVLY